MNDERKAIYDRILEKESQIKTIVPPSRSARDSKPKIAAGSVARKSSKILGAGKPKTVPPSKQPVVSEKFVYAFLAATFVFTVVGVFAIIQLGKSATAPIATAATMQTAVHQVKKPNVESPAAKDAAPEPTGKNSSPLSGEPTFAEQKPRQPIAAKLDPMPTTTQVAQTKQVQRSTPGDANTPTSKSNLAADATPPNAHQFWNDMRGLSSALVGTVEHARESNSGKTRYMYFSQDRSDTMAFLRTKDVGDELSLEYLQGLVGKKIVVRGKVENEFKRVGIRIRDISQIQVIE